MGNQDNSYKMLFSHREMVEDLLRGFVREPWVAHVDFATLEKVSGSYVADDLRDREDDVIWRVRLRDRWLYVYLLLEFQSTVDAHMAVRLMAYVALLYQDLIRTGAVAKGEKLPPVLPVVLYNGNRRWTAAEELADLIEDVPGGLARYRPRLRYLLLDEGRYADTELLPLRNLVAALFRLENSRGIADVAQALESLIEWLKESEQENLRRAFAVWFKRVFLPARVPGAEVPELHDLQEVKTMLAERVVEWTRQWKEEGRQEGEAALLERLLLRRYGTLPNWAEERLKTATLEEVERWAERLLDAESLEEVFRDK
jgi:predicted transposase/invertase (TIGR01784 family)